MFYHLLCLFYVRQYPLWLSNELNGSNTHLNRMYFARSWKLNEIINMFTWDNKTPSPCREGWSSQFLFNVTRITSLDPLTVLGSWWGCCVPFPCIGWTELMCFYSLFCCLDKSMVRDGSFENASTLIHTQLHRHIRAHVYRYVCIHIGMYASAHLYMYLYI